LGWGEAPLVWWFLNAETNDPEPAFPGGPRGWCSYLSNRAKTLHSRMPVKNPMLSGYIVKSCRSWYPPKEISKLQQMLIPGQGDRGSEIIVIAIPR